MILTFYRSLTKNIFSDFSTEHYFLLFASADEFSFDGNEFHRCAGGQESGGAFVTFEGLTSMESTISFTDTLFSECSFKKLGGINFGSATLKSLILSGIEATNNGKKEIVTLCVFRCSPQH